jgi:hypothetical protein
MIIYQIEVEDYDSASNEAEIGTPGELRSIFVRVDDYGKHFIESLGI